MALEEAIAALTKALEANTKALGAGGGGSSGGGYSYVAKHSQEEVANAVGEHKEKLGVPATKEMIKNAIGRESPFKEITKASELDKIYDAAQKALKVANEEV